MKQLKNYLIHDRRARVFVDGFCEQTLRSFSYESRNLEFCHPTCTLPQLRNSKPYLASSIRHVQILPVLLHIRACNNCHIQNSAAFRWDLDRYFLLVCKHQEVVILSYPFCTLYLYKHSVTVWRRTHFTGVTLHKRNKNYIDTEPRQNPRRKLHITMKPKRGEQTKRSSKRCSKAK